MLKSNSPHISVCIATYRRPILLNRCLGALQNQESCGFAYSIVVVDNDVGESAREVVEKWQQRSGVKIYYNVEPEQNISRTRNRAIADAKGDLIAFIDDDEFPEPTWLIILFEAYKKFSADGVLGPIFPYYEGTPPMWLVKSGLCIRKSFATGVTLKNLRYLRAGNLLFCRKILEIDKMPFDPHLGRTGGEDADFLYRMVKKGYRFVWCNEAIVHETVPKERQKRSYYMRRALIRGQTEADREPFISYGTMKSIAAAIGYTFLLPFLLVVGHHLFMRYIVRDCDHLGKLFSYCRVNPIREREF